MRPMNKKRMNVVDLENIVDEDMVEWFDENVSVKVKFL